MGSKRAGRPHAVAERALWVIGITGWCAVASAHRLSGATPPGTAPLTSVILYVLGPVALGTLTYCYVHRPGVTVALPLLGSLCGGLASTLAALVVDSVAVLTTPVLLVWLDWPEPPIARIVLAIGAGLGVLGGLAGLLGHRLWSALVR